MTYKETQCRDAIVEFGLDLQLIIAMEECGELIQAIAKFMRGDRHTVELVQNMAEEIADVRIMLTQLEIITHGKGVDDIGLREHKKLLRLQGRIEASRARYENS